MTKFNILSVLLLSVLIFGCTKCTTDTDSIEKPVKSVTPVKLISPLFDTQYSDGADISVEIQINDTTKVSGLNLFIADTLYAGNLKVESQKITISTKKSNVGFLDLYLAYTDEKGTEHRDNRRLIIFSDITPKQQFAKTINSYTHNSSAYTQGLEFYKGKLYESTGQKGSSLIAEVDLYSGNQVKTVDLAPQYFGEGLTILNDTIYQLTWQSRVCKLYDMDFNSIGEFHYEGEGWGLSNNGKSIIMTNGTSEVVWRNPRTFTVEKTIYAFADQQDYQSLNEIELINGKLFANVYTTNSIIEIDTTFGKVLSVISCDNLALEGRVNGADVLNGIAYNPLTKKTYLTGKLWPKLFEVTFE
jgi:glutamine cyclotransferase